MAKLNSFLKLSTKLPPEKKKRLPDAWNVLASFSFWFEGKFAFFKVLKEGA